MTISISGLIYKKKLFFNKLLISISAKEGCHRKLEQTTIVDSKKFLSTVTAPGQFLTSIFAVITNNYKKKNFKIADDIIFNLRILLVIVFYAKDDTAPGCVHAYAKAISKDLTQVVNNNNRIP